MWLLFYFWWLGFCKDRGYEVFDFFWVLGWDGASRVGRVKMVFMGVGYSGYFVISLFRRILGFFLCVYNLIYVVIKTS